MPVKKTSTEEKTEKLNGTEKTTRLFRSESDRVVAGVAGGLARYFDVDSTLIRLIFVLITIFGGSGILIYIILWIVIPNESYRGSSDESVHANVAEMKERFHKFADEARSRRERRHSRPLVGAILLFLGVLILLNNFGYFGFLNFDRLWPVFLVLLGLAILMRK